MSETSDVKKRSIIITGATGGLGRALTHHLAELFRDDEFVLFGRSLQKLEQLRDDVFKEQPGFKSTLIEADFTNPVWADDISEEVAAITQNPVRLLIHNAGHYSVSTLDEISPNEMNTGFQINVAAPVTLTQMVDQQLDEEALVIGIGSLGSYSGLSDAGFYATTKHALLGFLRSLREQYRARGVKVTALLPGPIYTDSWHGSGVDKIKLIQPEDICKIVSNLCTLSKSVNVDEIVLNPVRFNR
jgi:short-subunit dehydrogenase